MRKQEKQRKKQEQDKLKVGKDDPPPPALKPDPENRVVGSSNLNKTVDAKAIKEDSKGAVEDKTVTHLAESVEQLALTKKNEQRDELRTIPVEKAKTDLKNELKSVPSAADAKPKKDLSAEEQAAIKTAREAQKAAKAAAKAAAAQKKVTASRPDGTSSPLSMEVKPRKDGKEESGKNAEGKSTTEEKSATEVGRKQSGKGEATEDGAEGKSKAELKAERRAKQEAQRAAKSQVEQYNKN